METQSSFEIFVLYAILQDVIQEEWNLHLHRFENLISRLSVSMLHTVLLFDNKQI
jgi:hypothetical protein